MQKKGLIVIGVLLAVILCMQVRLLLRVNTIHNDMLSSDNFAYII